ncbi:dromaiocalcin-1-like [Apostichopus japonicus]|uniref:dromaiocalcin-1-like n=1 Tax=Stichopus japonicus TaxID=307972 RepID=UPI003AB463A5
MWINWRGSYYILATDLLTWNDAKAKCESLHEGVHLVFIEDAQEDEFIYDLITNASAGISYNWIGLSNNNTDGVWQWYDQPLVYSNWKEHQILTEAGYCAALKTTMHSSSWYTGQCDAYNAKFVCELEE